MVESEKAAKMNKAKIGSPARATPSSAASTAAARKPFKGDPEKRKHETDGAEINRTDSSTRNKVIGLIYNGLAYRNTDPVEDVMAKAMEVEAAAFERFQGETPAYKEKMRSLFQNLKNKTNKELGRRVMSGDVPAKRFVVMSHEELKSAEQKEQDSKLEKENMLKAQVPMMEKSVTDALGCSRCGQRKVSYSQAQTRSADEPMTTFCECTVCGNRWKVSNLPRALMALPLLTPLVVVLLDGPTDEGYGFGRRVRVFLQPSPRRGT
jgi:transcription elongation factor S-II